jgi:hypothetical protein
MAERGLVIAYRRLAITRPAAVVTKRWCLRAHEVAWSWGTGCQSVKAGRQLQSDRESGPGPQALQLSVLAW